MKKPLLILAVLLAIRATPAMANPFGFGFQCITTNAAGSCGIGEAQLSGTITAGTVPGDVLFTFNNVGPAASAIAELYFDTTLPFTSALAINGTGVDFCVSGEPCGSTSRNPRKVTTIYATTPGNLPGGTNVSFVADYSAGAINPAPTNGVNPGEHLGIEFHLASVAPDQALGTVILAVQQGTLRMGAHLVALTNGPSVSLVDQVTPVPEPMTLMLLGTGVCGLAAFRRRRLHATPTLDVSVLGTEKEDTHYSHLTVLHTLARGAGVSAPLRI